ncbi:MAG: gliding motility-associated C-terminal domain-containing protein, partial [Sphingobacteriales bacterium]
MSSSIAGATTTGQVADAGDFHSPGGKIGACFSPDDNLLYVGHFNKLSQYNAGLFPNVQDVENSEEVIATSITYGQMRRGPDGRIYIGNINDNNIAIIEQPNVQGPACNYELNGMIRPAYAQFAPLPPNNASGQYGSGLGQDVMPAGNMLTAVVRSVTDTIICGGKSIQLSVPDGYTRYLWSTGEETAGIVTNEPGVYWVRSFLNCTVYTDTFHVAAAGAEDWKLDADTAICPGDSLLINAWRPNILQYTWQDGSHDSVFVAPGEGTYTATVSIRGCALSDAIMITTLVPYVDIMERDTLVCRGSMITLHALAFPESTFLWDNQVSGPVLRTDEPGIHHVRAENVCGTFTDAVRVETETCDCIVFAPNAFSPNQDGRNDRFVVRADCPKLMTFSLTVYNRFGQAVYSSQDLNAGWDGTFRGRPADAGTYFYFLEYKPNDN